MIVALACFTLPLSACGGGGGALETFDLSAGAPIAVAGRSRGQLAIVEPVATSPVDSDRIVVRPSPDTVATLKGAQWSEPLPRLAQTRLLQTFENSHFLRAVGRPGSGIEARYSLVSEIRRFEIDVAAGEAVVEMSVKLVASASGSIVAGKVFSARAPGSAGSGAAAAVALDAALGDVMRDIVAWTAPRV
jgi:cholesterol transport system auxiliary component